MNRKDRREFAKRLKRSGLSEQMQKDIMERLRIQDEGEAIPCYEGEKVKLNYDIIINYPDWERLRPDYKEFVKTHKDVIFTVEFDEYKKSVKAKDTEYMVCLKEDITRPKFLFWTGDLIHLGYGDNPPVQEKTPLEEHMEKIEEAIKNH